MLKVAIRIAPQCAGGGPVQEWRTVQDEDANWAINISLVDNTALKQGVVVPGPNDGHHFHDEQAALRFVEAVVWRGSFKCSRCGQGDRISSQPSRPTWRACGRCNVRWSLREGTIFKGSTLPLHLWLKAIYILTFNDRSWTQADLGKAIGISPSGAKAIQDRIVPILARKRLLPHAPSASPNRPAEFRNRIRKIALADARK